MKRREIFKTLGLASIGVLSAGMILKDKNAIAQDVKKNPLILNRDRMSFIDPENPSKFELKHTPDITFNGTDSKGFTKVVITIGQQGIIHPTTPEHWIDFMKIYKNNQLVVENLFQNGPIRGYGEFFIDLKTSDTIKVEIGCNLHGIWESSVVFT